MRGEIAVESNLLELVCISSLEKVFPDENTKLRAYQSGSSLQGEVFSFQVAYRADRLVKRLKLELDLGGLPLKPDIYRVGLVPSELPAYGDEDDFILRSTPGIYPDPLYPLGENEELVAYPGQWRTIWIRIPVQKDTPEGKYAIQIRIQGKDDSTFGGNRNWYGQQMFTLSILPAVLPKQELIHTEWFAADCISTWYQLTAFSDEWWEMVNRYMQNYAKHGMNMILTPVFTPPIETKINTERPTIQLVGISTQDGTYTFDFGKLGRWMDMALACGITYFEMPHLFTQWGAYDTPKIMIWENGVEEAKFGWHVSAEDTEYLNFLGQLLPALVKYMTQKVKPVQVYFHISDEPGTDALNRYERLSAFVKKRIGSCNLMDALSEYEIFERSALTIPVVATDMVKKFMEQDVKQMWVYYACLQYRNSLSNRHFSMPSNRNRILGIQLYKSQIRGFLHWGYNHWYSGLSVKKINPFQITDADACFPSGDAFLVYPGEEGPINSIRLEVLLEGVQDYRALMHLESLIGREETIRFLERGIQPITFVQYPHDSAWLLDVRERVNQMIARVSKTR